MKNKYYEQFIKKVETDIKGVVRFAFAFVEANTIQEIVMDTLKNLENEQE